MNIYTWRVTGKELCLGLQTGTRREGMMDIYTWRMTGKELCLGMQTGTTYCGYCYCKKFEGLWTSTLGR